MLIPSPMAAMIASDLFFSLIKAIPSCLRSVMSRAMLKKKLCPSSSISRGLTSTGNVEPSFRLCTVSKDQSLQRLHLKHLVWDIVPGFGSADVLDGQPEQSFA